MTKTAVMASRDATPMANTTKFLQIVFSFEVKRGLRVFRVERKEKEDKDRIEKTQKRFFRA
jgi:hypothetical protein